MSGHLIRAQCPAPEIHLDKITHAPNPTEISRLREVGHVPYRCTRSYKTSKTDMHKP